MKANAGEVYTVYNQYLKRYTACQVAYIAPPDTVSEESWAVVLSLDWVGDAPLTAEELPHLRPLYKDFMYWPRDLHLLRVPLEVPPQYKLVGILPPFTDQPCRSYGGWSDGYDVYLQIRWQAIPEERRRAFKVAMDSDEQTEIGGIPVKVSSHRVTDQYEPFDSALELKALPCLSELICERWHPDLLEFLRENPFVDEVTLLNHGQRTLDLRGTSIRKLMLDMTGLAAVHPHLKELRLWGAPGNLGNFSAVRGFWELTNLSTFDLFGFGAADIPTPEQMPELCWFWMTSLPEDAAKAAKRLWKSKPGMDLRITKPRKPEWLAQNLDNPFRGWDGAEHIPAAAAKKAANQYRKTRSQLMKLAAEPGEDAQAQALDAVIAYTQTFNKMGFIETEERDEIYMALRGILDALPGDALQKDALIEQFDHVRNF